MVLGKYNLVFEKGLGKLKGTTAKIHIDPQTKLIFCKTRPVPYAIRPKLEAELDRLQCEGIIERAVLRVGLNHSPGYENRQLNSYLWRLQNHYQ